MSDYQISTDCLHAGYRPGNGEPRNIPIIQSTTFRYETSEEMGKLFDLDDGDVPGLPVSGAVARVEAVGGDLIIGHGNSFFLNDPAERNPLREFLIKKW